MLYPMQRVLRLCRRRTNVLQKHCTNHVRGTTGIGTKGDYDKNKDFKSLLQENRDKITFNSYLEHEKLSLGYFKYYLKTLKRAKKEHEKAFLDKSLPPLPIALQYHVSKGQLLKEEERENVPTEPDKAFQLPFANTTKVQIDKSSDIQSDDKDVFDRSEINKWMSNYEHFDDSQLLDSEETDHVDSSWSRHYGTPDRSASISRVACGGCGALLHCSDPAIPGYLPSEIFLHRADNELKAMECQRCHFLKEYNIALDVNVQPEEYEKLLQSIRHVKSLVLLMVDLLDFPCSVWPGIVDIIGTERPIFLVANKVDLLPGDSIGYMKRIKESLMAEIKKTQLAEANIKHVALISARTGYGVEDLITAMFKQWVYKGDVFLVGCTNVGKSSLFNALLQSDYCKVHAADIVKRATVSRWPGTTLNLLKFPINRPSGWKIYARTKRLKDEAQLMKIEKDIRKAQIEGLPDKERPSLMGHIGRSYSMFVDGDDRLNHNIEKRRLTVLDDKHKLLAHSKWFYDSPGVVHPDQVLSLLSTEELLVTIPRILIRPQTYYLRHGNTLFIGGLARIDFIYCEEPCRFTVFCAETLPITVTKTADADKLYEEFLGTELFAVPVGGAERMRSWPGLRKHDKVLEFDGEGPKQCCGDIVLSSVAWVSVTAKKQTLCRVEAWTPEARGVHRRYPSVLPFAINLKGKRIRDTPAYMVGKVFVEDE